MLAASVAALATHPAAAQDRPLTPTDPTAALPEPPQTSPPLERETPPADPAAGEVAIVEFRAARFTGVKAVDEARLRPAWQDQVGRQLTLSDLRAIARRAEAIYADAGYPFVAVVVPAQEIRDGTVQFNVVEGRITDLTMLGADPIARRQAAAAFQPLVDREPLAADDLERAYEAARTTPGLSIAGALRRGSRPGGMDLVLQTRRRGYRAYANINNLFSDPVGPWGVLVGVDVFGGSLYGDQTSIQLYSTFETDEQQVLRLSHSRRINRHGTNVAATYMVADSNPQGVVAPLDLATDVQVFRAEVSHPLVARLNGGVAVSVAFDWSDQETAVFNQIALTEDRTRVLSARLAGRWRNDRIIANGFLEARQGLDLGDASQPGDPLLSRPEGDPQAFVVRAGADAEVEVFPRVRLYGRVEGQFTEDVLLAPDEYSVGNLTIGRGYDPGSGFGDRALGMVLEGRLGPYEFVGPVRWSPFVFYDRVRLENEDSTGVVPEATLSSLGGGLRFEWPGRGRLDVVYAKPRDPLPVPNPPPGLEEPDERILVNLTLSLDPLFDGMFARFSRGDRR